MNLMLSCLVYFTDKASYEVFEIFNGKEGGGNPKELRKAEIRMQFEPLLYKIYFCRFIIDGGVVGILHPRSDRLWRGNMSNLRASVL